MDITEEGLCFEFPQGWFVSKYDELVYYRGTFQRLCGGAKAVDVIAVGGPRRCAYLIEIKDYRRHARTKAIDLADEVCRKVRDTLAAAVAVRVRDGAGAERAVADALLRAKALQVVLHLEQPTKPSHLVPRRFDPATVELKLRQLLKPIDAHPRVVEIATTARRYPWAVKSV